MNDNTQSIVGFVHYFGGVAYLRLSDVENLIKERETNNVEKDS